MISGPGKSSIYQAHQSLLTNQFSGLIPDRRSNRSSFAVRRLTHIQCQDLLHFLRQVNEDDIRVLAQSVEDDPFAVGCDVKCAHGRGIGEMGKLTALPGGQIQNPEVLCPLRALHIDESFSVGHESDSLAKAADFRLRQINRCSVRTNSMKRLNTADEFADINDESSVGRPYRSEERRVGKECRSRWSPYH